MTLIFTSCVLAGAGGCVDVDVDVDVEGCMGDCRGKNNKTVKAAFSYREGEPVSF